ncbi:P-loop containing nucleoside triphosphate hydrolase protein, partial [Mycena latifolia]
LPSEPKIFHGRGSEVSAVIRTFDQEVPRIAILGAGGMGKTSLAKAVLHHPEIATRYQKHRYFVACDSASTTVQLAAHIGAFIGLKPSKDLTSAVIRYFSRSPSCLLILDNLETLWEPATSRGEVERFLSLLANVDHLALIITMCGAERPANIQWTHPFLEPLKPLTREASREVFIDIADDGHASEDIDTILQMTDNLPLAISLVAHLVDYEGISSVLDRWETEKTSLFSIGLDRGSNLEQSISLSLASPRLTSLPYARELLSLLSMLPDGLSDVDLLQSKLPVDNILACKAALLRTSLAYVDDQRRLKTLVPIREYVYKMHHPMPHIVQPILKHFHKLLEIHETYFGTVSSPEMVARITLNFSNIQNMLLNGLNQDNPDLVNTIYCTWHFDRFSKQTGHGQTELIDRIPNVLSQLNDCRLEVYLITELFGGRSYHPIPNADSLVDRAIGYFTDLNDPDLECKLHVNCLKQILKYL